MSSVPLSKLPPNPYKRAPIKKKEDLAGRARELNLIRYYMKLTAAGQSPHLALIGPRGVGKTSLLNGAACIARELTLLPVRIDMNENKAKSPGRFWHDFYQTLTITMAKAGCWGGIQGPIYKEIFCMLHARKAGDLDKAVLQLPYAFCCHEGDIDGFECSDSLVEEDLNACIVELKGKECAGLVFLIDEADCIGCNVPLLQMFRNIFQVVDNCSLIMAGTEDVFPSLSKVFSPIPRQFFRIDVNPFATWIDTRALVMKPLPDESRDAIAPTPSKIRELHELCGGAPDEVQLYCHHMYRSVEEGMASRMALSPFVFREVLHEYRSNTPANVDAVLNAIERLPDNLLYQSRWLSRRGIDRGENIKITTLGNTLKAKKILSSEEKADIAAEIIGGYQNLYDQGITACSDRIALVGAPLTAGFWKSYVEVEKGKRWSWNDASYAKIVERILVGKIGSECGAAAQLELVPTDSTVHALNELRAGRKIPNIDECIDELVLTFLIAGDEKATHAIDMTMRIDSPGGQQKFKCRMLENPERKMHQVSVAQWINDRKPILADNDISLEIVDFVHWELPTPKEMHRLGRVSGVPMPDPIGPDEMNQAVDMFKNGDIPGACQVFELMLKDKDDPQVRNNLGFCQILIGQTADALQNIAKAMAEVFEPLHELNKGVCEFINGDSKAAEKSFRHALQGIEASEGRINPKDVLYVLVLESSERKVWYHADLPIDAAIFINMWRIGAMPRAELEAKLSTLYPERFKEWLEAFK